MKYLLRIPQYFFTMLIFIPCNSIMTLLCEVMEGHNWEMAKREIVKDSKLALTVDDPVVCVLSWALFILG